MHGSVFSAEGGTRKGPQPGPPCPDYCILERRIHLQAGRRTYAYAERIATFHFSPCRRRPAFLHETRFGGPA
jgi:hypothetical protein